MSSFTAFICVSLLTAPLLTLAESAPSGSFKLPLSRRITETPEFSRRGTGDVNLNTDTNVNWVVQLQIAQQPFVLGVDTGSSPLWVLSTEMPAAQQNSYEGHNFYNSSASKAFTSSSSHFTVAYDKGEIYANGDVGTDVVSMGSSGNLSATIPFGLATNISTGLVSSYTDGILGLAFGQSNQLGKGSPTFMEAVQSQLDQPVFTFHVPLEKQQFLEFGHVDSRLYNGTLQPVTINNGTPVDGLGWSALVSYSMNGKNISSALQHTLFDTGGVTARANPDVVRAYWASVKGATDISKARDATDWQFPCDSSLPDLSYDLVAPGGRISTATVPGRFFNYTALWPRRNTGKTCDGGLQSNGVSGAGTMGYAFWHSFFTVFNQAEPSVSFAPYPDADLDALSSVNGTPVTGAQTAIISTLPVQTAGGAKSTSSGKATREIAVLLPGVATILLSIFFVLGL